MMHNNNKNNNNNVDSSWTPVSGSKNETELLYAPAWETGVAVETLMTQTEGVMSWPVDRLTA